MNPRTIEFYYSTGYHNMDASAVKEYPHETNSWQIAQDAWNGAIENAALYGIRPYQDGDEFNDYECPCFVGDNITGTWKEII